MQESVHIAYQRSAAGHSIHQILYDYNHSTYVLVRRCDNFGFNETILIARPALIMACRTLGLETMNLQCILSDLGHGHVMLWDAIDLDVKLNRIHFLHVTGATGV